MEKVYILSKFICAIFYVENFKNERQITKNKLSGVSGYEE